MAAKRKSRKPVRKAKSTPPERVMDAMNQVWLAGLGALSKARQGAPYMLNELVAEGARVQADTRDSAEKMLGGLMGDVKATINSGVKTINSSMNQVRGQAGDALDSLETMFQTRVHRALTQLGVPSAEDVEKLSHRVEKLNSSIIKLASKRGSAGRQRTPAARKARSTHAS
jgi:poly(hydroxyalkanoate) granule-associated protein